MISHQAQGYMDGLGDLWYSNNKTDLGKRDLVSELIEHAGIVPTAVLEVGCANGWLLKRLRERYGCAILGIDPSQRAIADAGDPATFQVGLSTNIPINDRQVDLVIMGYCLWATPPEDWFKTVAEADRVLVEGGHLIILDSVTPRFFRRKYCETPDGKVFHQFYYDWSRLWTSHPAYKVLGEAMTPGQHAIICATALRKDTWASLSMDLKE